MSAMDEMIEIDGSFGEGGGQVLRTSLSLSLITGRPFRIEQIRGRRKKPGLMRQHLTAVQAAARISNARVDGPELGSTELVFEPGAVTPGEYAFSVGTAGSTMLVLQTILPPLLLCEQPSEISVDGGTHNMQAPVFEFLDRSFRPQLASLGARVDFVLERHGFYPAGGGRVRASIGQGLDRRSRLELVERGPLEQVRAISLLAHLPGHVAEREFERLHELLEVPLDEVAAIAVEESDSRGNTLLVELASANVTEVFSEIGRRGVRAEEVAERLAERVNHYIAGGAPVGPHLADQLLLPMALTGGGVFRTSQCTAHTETQIELIPRFLDVGFERIDDGETTSIRVETRSVETR